jgi:hypothetical protein
MKKNEQIQESVELKSKSDRHPCHWGPSTKGKVKGTEKTLE